MLTTLIFCLFAYCIGSFSSAVIVCRLAGLPDPRTTGSKNPGATNVLRLGGKKAAVATLLGDALKGVIPVLIALQINPAPEFVGPVMVSVFLGHLYPVFFGFQGGKGVATALGAILAMAWPVGLMCVGTWGLVVWCSRFSSLGALVAAALAPVYAGLWLDIKFAIPVFVMSIFLLWRHRGNIKRLLQGAEPRVGK